ncbi:type I methionyl aminopeptidase, partial [Bacillus velezensis]
TYNTNYVTVDVKNCTNFEKTIAITETGFDILTKV